jgi:hypothetical protein
VTCHRHQSAAKLRRLAVLGLAAWLQGYSLAHATEPPQPIILEVDRARLISLPKGRREIIIGNPSIARVTPLADGSRAVLTGMAFGTTSMTVLDATGAIVMDSIIQVKEAPDIAVIVYRGGERSSYAGCSRQCQPRLQLGDNSKDFKDIGSQIQSREPKADVPRMASRGSL